MVIHGEAKTICAALVKARSDMKATVTKDGQGNYGQYATLAAIVAATTPHFAAHGLAVVQEVSTDENGIVIHTTLLHESGATIEFAPLPMPLANRTPQAVGSAITYGRRYALAAICGIAPEDDDAQAAEDAQKAAQPSKQARTMQKTSVAPSVTPTSKPRATVEQVQQLDALGNEFYGDEWAQQRTKLAAAVSKGAVQQPTELLATEITKLIEGIAGKMAQVNIATAETIPH